MSIFEKSLYGSRDTVVFDGVCGVIPTYFATYSDFYNHAGNLDGAIVSIGEKARLCLNPHSERYEGLKRSELRQVFENGVCDPVQEESDGRAFIVDGCVNRNDESEVIRYLQEKYHRSKIMFLDMKHYSATTQVRK